MHVRKYDFLQQLEIAIQVIYLDLSSINDRNSCVSNYNIIIALF